MELVTVVSEERNGSISLSTIPIERFYRARGQNAVLSLSLPLRDAGHFYTCVMRRPRNKYIEFTHVRSFDRYRYDLTDDSRLRNEHRAQLRRLSYGTPLSARQFFLG